MLSFNFSGRTLTLNKKLDDYEKEQSIVKTVKIYNASDEFEAQKLINILEENHIPCYTMNSDIGEYMRITQGFSVFGLDLYVDSEDEIRAKELVEQACNEMVMNPEIVEENYKVPWYRNRVIIARLLLICGIGVVILIWILGNVGGAKTYEVDSTMYSQDDISLAIAEIKKEFKSDWKGCTLKEIYYAGDKHIKLYQDWAERNNADEVIVLLSSFDVDSSGGDGSLNPNSTYDGWNWILE